MWGKIKFSYSLTSGGKLSFLIHNPVCFLLNDINFENLLTYDFVLWICYITWQRGISLYIKLKLLIRWPKIARLPWVTQFSLGSLKVETGGRRRATFRVMQCKKDLSGHCWLCRWMVAMGQGFRRPLEARKGRETNASLESPEGKHPADALSLAYWNTHQMSDLQNYKIIKFVLF